MAECYWSQCHCPDAEPCTEHAGFWRVRRLRREQLTLAGQAITYLQPYAREYSVRSNWASRRASRPSLTFWKKPGSSLIAIRRGWGRSTSIVRMTLVPVRAEGPRLITTTRSDRKT